MAKKITMIILSENEDKIDYIPYIYKGDSFYYHKLIKMIRDDAEEDELKNKILLFPAMDFLYDKKIAIVLDENTDIKYLEKNELKEVIEALKKMDKNVVLECSFYK